MRIIKFRGKCAKDSRYAGEWVEGGVLQCEKSDDVLIVYAITDTCSCTYHVDPDTVGQYTGLTDRNGKEIYEGDVLVIKGIKYPRHYVVHWNSEKLMFCVGDTPLYAILEVGCTTIREYSVCGNVHDNPELIKGGEQ